jgi:DNA-binding transcriptional regulator YiaG
MPRRSDLPTMQPAEFRRIRKRLKLSQAELALMLGYTRQSGKGSVAHFESESIARRLIPPAVARLMRAYAAGYRPDDWPHSDAS